MPVGGRSVQIDQAELDRIVRGPAGPVAAYLYGLTQKVVQRAKAKAPVGAPSKTPEGHPAGYLRSNIEWAAGSDGQGVWTEVGDPAVTSRANPFPGEPYAEQIEFPQTRRRKPPPFARSAKPYVVPALVEVFREEGA
jgi:hypothetical protein